MKKKKLIAVGITAIFLVTGCRSSSGNAENEALKEQITQLEQQVTTLEQQITAAEDAVVSTQETSAAADNDTQEQSALSATRTMEELTAMVDAFVEKADAAALDGTSSENIEQFFALKQEEKQIDDALDLHEDELEYLYRQNTLTRDEYKKLERELERLEDKLDDAEDQLEYTYGIDD